MAETIASESVAIPVSRGLLARFVGVLTSPRATYADIARQPTWLGMFLLVVIVSTACQGWLSSTAIGRQAAIEKATEMVRLVGQRIPEERLTAMREQIMTMPAWRAYLNAVLGSIVFVAIGSAIITGVLLAIFNAVLGGAATFTQLFAVVMFSDAVVVVKTIFTTPLNYARESFSNPTTFAALLPMLDEKGLMAAVLGSVDFFWLWWLVSLAIGLGVLYKRPTQGIAVSLISTYVVLAVTISAGIALIAG